ncbi:MAG TPA: hypothetical protein VFZ21_00505, partial [Gemmatimonadaceae bacterium]|nr:hypothetical protein [Gemmatimonadaceae bacterium]
MNELPRASGHENGTTDRRAHSPSRRLGTARAKRSLAAQFAAARSPIDVVADRLTRWAASTPFLV